MTSSLVRIAISLLFALQFTFLSSAFALVMESSISTSKVIDSHLHVWASTDESKKFPYADGQDPPSTLANRASTEQLLKRMDGAGVDGALIVQPINHKFDHSYVEAAMSAHPTKFKGMLLHDPALDATEAVARLEELALRGFVGVRFNPYLWPSGGLMSEEGGCGLAVYKRCAELHMPVGVMCFKGLGLHYDDIVKLIESSPDTMIVLDHFGFTGINDDGEKAFRQLLSLAKYKNVVVKISALFRVAGPGDDPFPYNEVRLRRFTPLLEAFGADRLMFGTDFPFVLDEKGSYAGTVELVRSWLSRASERDAVMGGTAEKLFGPWGACSSTVGNS